jgi:hypothetical protein
MSFNQLIRYTGGRSCDIYGAQGWGDTRSNCLKFIMYGRYCPQIGSQSPIGVLVKGTVTLAVVLQRLAQC